MPHKVEISDKTYDKLKEYCELNDLKIGQLADKFIYDSLMIELYGDVPFTDYKRKPKKHEEMVEIQVSTEDVPEVPFMKPEYEEPSEEFIKEWTEIEKYHQNQAKVNETLKEVGVPDKVVNKITRRRLK